MTRIKSACVLAPSVHLTPPCPALPCPALSYPALSCPLLPCPALFRSSLDTRLYCDTLYALRIARTNRCSTDLIYRATNYNVDDFACGRNFKLCKLTREQLVCCDSMVYTRCTMYGACCMLHASCCMVPSAR